MLLDMKTSVAVIILIALAINAKCAKILCIFPMIAPSHYKLGIALAKELALKDHEITIVSPFPHQPPIKNIKDISVAEIIQQVEGHRGNLFKLNKFNFFQQTYFLIYLGETFTKRVFNISAFKDLLRSEDQFDVLIIQNFANGAFFGLGHHFKCPIIVLALGPVSCLDNHLVGNPWASSYVPNLQSGFSAEMNLWQRIKNLGFNVIRELVIHLYTTPMHNKILKNTLPNSPDLQDLYDNVSLILSASDVSIHVPQPYLPAIKEVGGYHIRKPKKLPEELQDYLDGAKDGIIVFSMGSNLKSAYLLESNKKAILNTFAKIKQNVLWKYETNLPEKSSNVKVMPWLPQNDVLAHPNVKLFITHGGLLSLTEAVYHGVPILGIPVYWDQKLNIQTATDNGYSLNIPYDELTEEAFFTCINEMLDNPKYKENIKLRSLIMHDQPLKPMDKAIFWVEYVIRHKGARHLRSPSMDLNWYQRSMLDVIVVLTIVAIGALILIYKVVKCLLIFGSRIKIVLDKKIK